MEWEVEASSAKGRPRRPMTGQQAPLSLPWEDEQIIQREGWLCGKMDRRGLRWSQSGPTESFPSGREGRLVLGASIRGISKNAFTKLALQTRAAPFSACRSPGAGGGAGERE